MEQDKMNTNIDKEQTLENKIGWFPITSFGASCLVAGASAHNLINNLMKRNYGLATIDGIFLLGTGLYAYVVGTGLSRFGYLKFDKKQE